MNCDIKIVHAEEMLSICEDACPDLVTCRLAFRGKLMSLVLVLLSSRLLLLLSSHCNTSPFLLSQLSKLSVHSGMCGCHGISPP